MRAVASPVAAVGGSHVRRTGSQLCCVLHPHDRAWSGAATRRISRLRNAVSAFEGAEGWSFEHIGSTAVPGLAAKPILDLQVVAPSIPAAPVLDDRLRDIGYLPARGSRPDSPGVYRDSPRGSEPVADEVWVKRLFYSPDPVQPVILHLRLSASPFGRHTVWFRDWLTAHPSERDRYQRVKADLARVHAQDGDYDDYTRGKTAYLDEVQDRFEAWGRGTRGRRRSADRPVGRTMSPGADLGLPVSGDKSRADPHHHTAGGCMAGTLQPIIGTPDVDRLLAFYTGLFGAMQTSRVPPDGPAFYLGLEIGASELGLVAADEAEIGTPQRILLSFAVDDVDGTLDRVTPLGGKVLGPPNDMPWGQRVAHIQDPDGNAVNLTQDL